MRYSMHYLKWHEDSIEHYEQMSNFYIENFFSDIPSDRSVRILDVGCSIGLNMYALQKNGYSNVKGIEIQYDLAKIGMKHGLDIEVVEDSMNWLNAHQDTFDVVFLLDVLEHIDKKDQQSFLKSISNSLRDQGVLICSVPNANSVIAPRYRYIDWTHCMSFTEHSLEFIILNSGFNECKIFELDFFHFPGVSARIFRYFLFKVFRYVRRLQFVAELGAEGKNIPLSLNLKAVAKK